MNIKLNKRFWRTLFVTTFFLVTVNSNAQHAPSETSANQSTQQAQAVSQQVYAKLQVVQESIDRENSEVALHLLQSLLDKGGLSDYELAQVLTYKAFVEYGRGDTERAIDTYSLLLETPNLELASRQQALYTTAQLRTSVEDYEGAIRDLDEWFALVVEVDESAYVLYAQNLYQVSRYEELLEPLEMAIALAKKKGNDPKEDWYVLLSYAYFRQENYTKVRDIHLVLLERWPSKEYWLTLAAAFAELRDDDSFLAAYDALYLQGLLDKDTEFTTLAQLYLQYEIPFHAGQVLSTEIGLGRVAPSASNYRLLSQAWSMAHEPERSIPALTQAAKLSDDGELDIRLATSLLNIGQYSDCVHAAKAGLAKGAIRSPENAQITLGLCLYNNLEFAAAASAFRGALTDPATERLAQGWIDVIVREIERKEQIDAAIAATEARIQQLEERRARSHGS